ncbi:glycosyltransferase family 4 protein [Ectothiorhodospira sp. BSL-9]|uniref:glycosyltransferase family 4 protein n=1 Tax=Ectothiorhodospira sp. BSL-9 TaxID=1442136 RepID=UPI0009EDED9B|nr:glycosyltransferase family 4 protein [Ectothiorhodospira sp. BSL-9]
MLKSILQIITAPASGGAEILVRSLSCKLVAMGYTVHIAFIDRATDLQRSVEFERDFLRRLREQGVSYSFLGHETRRKPWLGAWRVRSIVREKKIDLIHSHLAYGNIFAAGAPQTPLIYTHHSEKSRFSKFYWDYFEYRAAGFIGISRVCTNNLRHFLRRDTTIHCIPNGVDLAEIPTRNPSVGLTSECVRAICVGRVAPQKNYELLVSAVSKLPDYHRRRLTIDIFGEGDPKIIRSCEAILDQAGISPEIVRFFGSSSKIRKILHEYDLFFMSSKWEGLPIALIEATAAGLPCIVTDVGGCREVVEAGPSGIVVPSSDIEAYRDAIQRLMSQPGLRERFSLNAYETARNYSIESAVERHAQVYQQII